jgi:aminoglycoside phosphotransferase family enzyme/predicted kinase
VGGDVGRDDRRPGPPDLHSSSTGSGRDRPSRIAETHVSTLFFVGDRVYKLRKPVLFGFVDFTEPDARRIDCEREVELNRRLAPDVYLGVAELQLGGQTIEHMVVMRRLPGERRLANLARQGANIDGWLEQVARALAAFHARADRSTAISEAATGASLWAGWQANFAETAPFVGAVLDEGTDREIWSRAERWTSGREPLFERRIDGGRVCDGHGDLQAEDIFCLDDGVRILDCVEFSDHLRFADVTADVAFLVMDLEQLGYPVAAEHFLTCYRRLAADPMPDGLVHYYCAARAYVRAKVCCLRYAQGSDVARTEARRLHELALSHLCRASVTLVLVGGLPGTGKSTVAAGIGEARGWTVLRSDELRADVVPPTGPGAPGYLSGRYGPGATESVYAELLRRADRSLGMAESVVLDASWVSGARRSEARTVAERSLSDLVELRCDAAAEVADRRIRLRLAERGDPSEATPEVREAMQRSMDPWTPDALVETSSTTPAEAVALALAALTGHHPSADGEPGPWAVERA